jgi:hypothetical protein
MVLHTFSCSAGKIYKYFYLEGQEETWRNQQGNRTKWSEKQAGQESGRPDIPINIRTSAAASALLLNFR